MRRKILLTFILCLICFNTVIYASQGYEFNLEYEGNIIANEPKDGVVTLTGTEGTPYTNVRVQSEHISGPAIATIYAYDEGGNKFDITESGAWGPTSGFAIGGTFKNETQISAVYPKAGTYVSRLSLIDLNNNNAVITSKEFTITVYEKEAEENKKNEITNITNNVNNEIETIPEAGTSIWVYIAWLIAFILIAGIGLSVVKNKKD